MNATVEKVYKGKVVVTATQQCRNIDDLMSFLHKMQIESCFKDMLEDLGRPNVVYRAQLEDSSVQNS